MPELDGFQVVRELRGERAPKVIYVTAFSEHALQAFDVGALDYLLKPVRAARMAAALERTRTQLEGMRRPAEGVSAGADVRPIAGKRGGETHLFRPEDAIAFEADGDIVYLHVRSGRFQAEGTLKELAESLPRPPFVRVHRSTIVNTDHVRRLAPLSSKRWLLTMSNGLEVVASKRMKGALRDVGA
jgi:DNA-binding LytR/AlgR family response regulator